eukprot:GHVS01006702.1.p1 GENE.GHVS01006702.1~~GHVS01006702.1.p1  ORF type:complete len:266 (+),score=28.67 GHVS01006702.1:66-800(+)
MSPKDSAVRTAEGSPRCSSGSSNASGCSADTISKTEADVITTPVGLDEFAFKQFDDPQYNGTRIDKIGKKEFLQQVNEIISSKTVCLKPGYADFCKHIFLPNFAKSRISVVPITPQNKHLLRSGYVARRPEELPVLCRWFRNQDVSEEVREARFLDIILYSGEQIAKESEAMQRQLAGPLAAWNVIAIKAQDEDYELPMAPITMLRNTLISEGGSGVSFCRSAYLRSVVYWENHANISESTDGL